MNYKDIRQFTQNANYSIHVPLDDIERTVNRYVTEYGLNMDPDFQRGHVWHRDQQSRYIEYLLRGGISSRTILFNYPGWMRDFKGDFVLVDGKQRLEAIRGFFADQVPVFGHLFGEIEGRLPTMNAMIFAINNLKTRAEMLQWYLDLNTGGVVHSDDEISKVQKLLEMESDKK